MKRFLSGLALAAFSFAAATTSYAATPDLRMYRLDCGHMTLGDKSVMSDEGLYHGQSYDIVMSCYLIKHGEDWLLWDAGLPEKYLAGPVIEGSFTTGLERTIVEQLADLDHSARRARSNGRYQEGCCALHRSRSVQLAHLR